MSRRARRPVVLLAGILPPSRGGITALLVTLLESDLARRFDIVPFNTGRPPKPATMDNFGYRALWNSGFRRMLQAIRVTLWHVLTFPIALIRHKPAVAHVHTSPHWVFWETAIYALQCRVLGVPCLLHFHYSFTWFHDGCSPVGKWMIRRVLRLVDVFVVICREDVDRARRMTGDRTVVAYVPNFVDFSGIDASVRAEGNGAPEDAAPEILFLGGSEALRKGLGDLLEAYPSIRARAPEVTLRLTAVPSDLLADLVPGGADSGVVCEPWMGGEQKFARFGRARVFALPSQGEGMPIAMLEAMAAGLPVVATPVGGVGDVIRDDVEGILVPPSDPSALGRALSQLVENPDRARAMGDRARERVRNAFDVRHGVDALTKLYLAAGRLERAGHESAVRVPAGTGDAEG